MVKAVIFDLDGVLVDATDWHFEALNRALNVFGYLIQREDHLKVYNGLPTNEKLKILSNKQGLPTDLHSLIQSLKRKYTDEIVDQKCRPSHSKQLLLTHLQKKYRLAVCSNAQKYSVLNMLRRSQIDNFFEYIIGNDEGYKPKPSPEIYLAAFQKMKISPKEAVIIEDAPHGVKAAIDSGARVIKVRGFNEVNLSLFINIKLL